MTTVLLAAFILVGVQMPVLADIVSTDKFATEQRTQIQGDAERIILDRGDVQAQLEVRGVDASDALQRVDNLTAAELATLAEQIDTLPAGEGVLGAVIGMIVIFMLLDIAGVTDVFPAL